MKQVLFMSHFYLIIFCVPWIFFQIVLQDVDKDTHLLFLINAYGKWRKKTSTKLIRKPQRWSIRVPFRPSLFLSSSLSRLSYQLKSNLPPAKYLKKMNLGVHTFIENHFLLKYHLPPVCLLSLLPHYRGRKYACSYRWDSPAHDHCRNRRKPTER